MTSKGRTVIGTIAAVNHHSTSGMGNPTYRITLEDGSEFLTQTNGGVGYAATNWRPRTHLGETPRRVVLSLTPGGRVWDIERAASVYLHATPDATPEIVAIVRDHGNGITRVRRLNPGPVGRRRRGESSAEYAARRASHGYLDLGTKALKFDF